VRTLGDVVARLSESAWALGALAAALDAGLGAALAEPGTAGEVAARAGLDRELTARLLAVLEQLELAEERAGRWSAPALAEAGEGGRADARNAVLQADALARQALAGALAPGWGHDDPAILETQGVMSGRAIEPLTRFVFPALAGLEERLAAPGAGFLDVGAGVAAVSIELCRRFPAVRAVGLEPAAAPRELARARVVAAGLADRIEIRDQLVQDLADSDAFDLVWLPLNFLPEPVAATALQTVRRALKPGGYVLISTLGVPQEGGDLGDALAAFRTVLWGGAAIAPERAAALVEAAGFADVRTLPRTPARMTPLVARR
jgi:SAM-dependent methyltransferase